MIGGRNNQFDISNTFNGHIHSVLKSSFSEIGFFSSWKWLPLYWEMSWYYSLKKNPLHQVLLLMISNKAKTTLSDEVVWTILSM